VSTESTPLHAVLFYKRQRQVKVVPYLAPNQQGLKALKISSSRGDRITLMIRLQVSGQEVSIELVTRSKENGIMNYCSVKAISAKSI
jgi:hypothetical protein